VRRGALKRFHNLQQKTRELPVNVVWDERQAERRTGVAAIPVESRKRERRRTPATTWGIADFVVAVPAPPARKKKAT